MPIAIGLIVALPLIIGALWLFAAAYTHTVVQGSASGKQDGSFVQMWIRGLEFVPKLLLGLAAKASRAILSHWAEASLRVVARWFDGLTHVVSGLSSEVERLARDTAYAIEHLASRTLPHALAGALAPIRTELRHALKRIDQAWERIRGIDRALTRFEASTAQRLRELARGIDRIITHEIPALRAGEAALEHGYADLRDRTIALEDGAVRTFRWLNAHRDTAAFGLFTGAVAWALARLGYGFLRCRSWRNLGRQMKCSDANILADLLAGATAIAFSMSLVELAKAEQGVIDEVATVVKDFWQA